MAVRRRDRMTNVRPGRRVTDPCDSCAGEGALLPLPNGHLAAARFVVPNRRAWSSLPVAPCPVCEGTGATLDRRPRRWGQG